MEEASTETLFCDVLIINVKIAGSKCPTGEHLYSIETKDNSGLKKLFNDLSNHKPIFADDRLGRRMTLEKSLNQTAPRKGLTPQRTNKNR